MVLQHFTDTVRSPMNEGFKQLEQRIAEVRSSMATHDVVFDLTEHISHDSGTNGHIPMTKEERRKHNLALLPPVARRAYEIKNKKREELRRFHRS